MSDQILDFHDADLEYREDADTGYVEGIAVPWGQTATIHLKDGTSFKESFAARSIEPEGTVWLYDQHRHPVGELVEMEHREEGYWFRAKLALSDLAMTVREKLRNGAYKALSVGFVPVETRDENGVRVVVRARLREVSVVSRPAYAGATVLSIREASEGREPATNPKETVMTDETPADLTEVRESVEELSRRFDAFTPAAPVEAEEIDQRSAGAVLQAIVAGDTATIERYTAIQEHRHDELQRRAYTGGTTADAPVKDAWVGDLTRLFDSSSGVLASFFSTGTLPGTGMNVEYAELLDNTITVTEQVNQGDDLPVGKVRLTTKTAPVKTYGGATQLTRQAIERSTLPVLNRSLEALTIEAAKRRKVVLRDAVNGVLTARKAVASNGGVIVLGSTLAASDAGRWEDALIDAAIRFDAQALELERMFVSASVFKKLRSLTVSGERVFRVNERNASGTLDLPGLRGDFAGIPVSLDPGQTGDEAYFANHRAVRQYLSAVNSLSDENVINLTKDFSVYFYGATAAEIPQAIVPVKLAAS